MVVFIWACSEPQITLNKNERMEADSLYGERLKPIRAELDSLCDIRHNELLQKRVDSIVEIRKIELNALLQ